MAGSGTGDILHVQYSSNLSPHIPGRHIYYISDLVIGDESIIIGKIIRTAVFLQI